MSTFSDVCDAVITDLQNNITALNTTNVPAAQVHRYAPWNVEELAASAGERHLAVWPLGEAENAQQIATGAIEFTESYVILVWEDASVETSRLRADNTTTSTFLDIHASVRARFLVSANETIGGSELTRYIGVDLPEIPSQVRWFRVVIRMARSRAIS